ncbi:hypothetical protein HGA13_17100 [Nocardia speluncae]|uniref:Uncharacterized protein n=1 Tax=Nocardia speluncae TaxID=419477 RepID=A0A846XHU0_9NOCA|nr:hypothetical protein [Nocardia speluncae]NKY34779.1 hypothetical protein [Nocardia speluncae]
MAPEQTSPHWDRIVGDNWPQIPPSAWHGLESAAREGAAALNLTDVEQARRAFEETVEQSAGLEYIRMALIALENNPRVFAAALTAAADTFGTLGDIVRRTRNQILDVVENTEDRIDAATRGDNNDDGVEDDEAEAEKDRQATEAILAEAQGDVEDIVAAALRSLGPQGLPRLDDIAEALGQPGPWASGAGPGGAPPAPGTGAPDGGDSWGPGSGTDPGTWHRNPGLDGLVPPDAALGQVLIDYFWDLLTPGPVPADLTQPLPGGEVVGAPDVPTGMPTPAIPGQDAPGQDQTLVGALPPGEGVNVPASETDSSAAGVSAEEAPAAGGSETGGQTEESPAEAESTEELEDSASDSATRTDPEGSGISLEDARTEPPAGETTGGAPGMFGAGLAMGAVSTAGSTGSEPAATRSAASAGGTSPAGSATGSAALPSTPASRGAAGPIEASRGPGATGKMISTANIPGVVAPGGRGPGALPDGDSGGDKRRGAEEAVQGAVGAAMAASAAPAFVVGERVDGDLVLARTLLGGIRAAADPWVVGVDWAVAVLRHPSGVSAFVTSNEGRGWLPARLYLPTELSLPWLWAVAEDSGWEGIADPARVLVEFAIAWGAKSGSKLSALASSQPIDPALGGQLTTVALAGSVGPSEAMDLRTPTAGMLDRLGLTATPRLLDRAVSVPDHSVALRCLEYAVDAHTRVERAGIRAVDAMGAPEIRLRILRALRDGREFAAGWWEEMQDADDLIAATILGHRAVTSRIALGELRPAATDFEPDSELSVLRALTFQRRCNELVLLLGEDRTRQTLRDAVYTHSQILAHPHFVRSPAAAPVPQRGVVSTGTVR